MRLFYPNTVGIAAVSAVGAYAVYRLSRYIARELSSPGRNIPGPPREDFIFGIDRLIQRPDALAAWEGLFARYGKVFVASGFLGIRAWQIIDLKAVNHILTHTDVYMKPDAGRYTLGRMLGQGVLVVEGQKHTQQRKVMNPAFGSSQIRELTEVFVDKALLLRDLWQLEISKAQDSNLAPKMDVLPWLGRMTLDVIGLAGFNYAFDSLNPEGERNELNEALKVILRPTVETSAFTALQVFFPVFRSIPSFRESLIKSAKNTMLRIGNELLRESKLSVLNENEEKGVRSDKGIARPKDLLSLLVRANMATDVPESQKLSDEDVLAQIPTFLVAGHETTSTGTAWALYALATDKRVQNKLRAELLEMGTDRPTMDELNSCTYLDYVVRETMRFHSPIFATVREAEEDDIIPLETAFAGVDGKMIDHLKIRKGDFIGIPFLLINRSKELWGDDAGEFKPERWGSVPEATSTIPGIWGNMLTFWGGSRGCIGFRFSIVETKAILYTLIRAFEFELDARPEDIGRSAAIVQRPYVIGRAEEGGQLPMLVRPL